MSDNPDTTNYVVVRTVTHRVEKDVARTMNRAYANIVQAKQELGPHAVLVLTLMAYTPSTKALLPEETTR